MRMREGFGGNVTGETGKMRGSLRQAQGRLLHYGGKSAASGRDDASLGTMSGVKA
jgi:hypothetical protein